MPVLIGKSNPPIRFLPPSSSQQLFPLRGDVFSLKVQFLFFLIRQFPNLFDLKIVEREREYNGRKRRIFDREDDGDNFNRDGYLFYFFVPNVIGPLNARPFCPR